jgi:hypothetical protein
LLVIYTPSHVCSARDPGLARRLAEGSAPKRETRVTSSYLLIAVYLLFKLDSKEVSSLTI